LAGLVTGVGHLLYVSALRVRM